MDVPVTGNKNRESDVQVGLHRNSDPLGAYSSNSLALEHLRNHSHYLLSGGPAGIAKAGGQLIYGIGIQLILVLTITFAIAFVLFACKFGFSALAAGFLIPQEFIAAIPKVTFLGVVTVWLVVLSVLPIVRGNNNNTPVWEGAAFYLGIVVFVLLFVYCLHHGFKVIVPKENPEDIIGKLMIVQI